MDDLSDLTIIDLTRILSGPYCTQYFADFGADVIKIEPPSGDDTRTWGPPFVGGESAYFLSVNRNKRSVVLDLKTDEGHDALEELIRRADVVVENFRPDTLKRLGFDFERLTALNPRIILASISGFGQTGRYRNEPGYDIIAQGMGGLMAVTGEPAGPPVKAGFSLADLGTGMWAVIGILTALHHRDRTGEPQWVDVSLLETMLGWQTYIAQNYFASGKDPLPMGRMHPNLCPYQAFAAEDGYFNLGVGNERLWQSLCETLEEPDWVNDPRFRTNSDRVRNRDTLAAILEARFRTKPVSLWVERFRARKIPCGPVYRISEIYQDPYIAEREMLFTVHHPMAGDVPMVSTPVHFLRGREERKTFTPPPLLGQHTAEVLQELGIKEQKHHTV